MTERKPLREIGQEFTVRWKHVPETFAAFMNIIDRVFSGEIDRWGTRKEYLISVLPPVGMYASSYTCRRGEHTPQ